jgi:hypothetical protein
MKKNSFLVLGMLAMVLTFGFVLSGCATAKAPAAAVPADDGVEKTIFITGFDLPAAGIKQIKVDLTGDWVDEQDWWIIPANCVAKAEGQTLTAWLWRPNVDGERWTGTGKYGINIYLISESGPVKTYRYGYHTGNEWVTIKDAETTLNWSDFVFAWED